MWSTKFTVCTSCKTSDYAYMAKGLCRHCYLKQYRNKPENKARAVKLKADWYKANPNTARAKQRREQLHFGGLRDAALQRANNVCEECGISTSLVVHHKDGNGRGTTQPNNSLDNLQVLCRSCHQRVHRSLVDRWSVKYDSCQMCGTKEVPHNARGYCRLCYPKWHKQQKS